MQRGYHVDDLFFIVDFIKKPPGADSISPRFGIKALQFFDMGSKMGMFLQLRINEFKQFLGDLLLAG